MASQRRENLGQANQRAVDCVLQWSPLVATVAHCVAEIPAERTNAGIHFVTRYSVDRKGISRPGQLRDMNLIAQNQPKIDDAMIQKNKQT